MLNRQPTRVFNRVKMMNAVNSKCYIKAEFEPVLSKIEGYLFECRLQGVQKPRKKFSNH